MKLLSFYTDQPPEYKKHLEEFIVPGGFEHIVEEVPTEGDWYYNCYIKPRIILKHLAEEPILYLDIDARIRCDGNTLKSMLPDCDIAATLMPDGSYFASMVYVTPRAREFVQRWSNICPMIRHRVADQHAFNLAVKEYPDLRIVSLDMRLAKIIGLSKDNAPGLVEHLQASRQTRLLVDHDVTIPRSIHRTKIARLYDGGYELIRPTAEAIAYMSTVCEPCASYPNRWYLKSRSSGKHERLKPWMQGKNIHIIGKGPSLDNISLTIPIDEPVIAINESIFKIEELGLKNPVFMLQQDIDLQERCRPKKLAGVIVNNNNPCYGDYGARYHYVTKGSCLSVEAAIAIAVKNEAKKIYLHCFDSCTNGSLDYALCIGHNSAMGGSPRRFKGHRSRIVEACGKLPYEFVTH